MRGSCLGGQGCCHPAFLPDRALSLPYPARFTPEPQPEPRRAPPDAPPPQAQALGVPARPAGAPHVARRAREPTPAGHRQPRPVSVGLSFTPARPGPRWLPSPCVPSPPWPPEAHSARPACDRGGSPAPASGPPIAAGLPGRPRVGAGEGPGPPVPPGWLCPKPAVCATEASKIKLPLQN